MSMSYHQMLKGSSKRVIRIPWSTFLALSPRACLPVHGRTEMARDNGSGKTADLCRR